MLANVHFFHSTESFKRLAQLLLGAYLRNKKTNSFKSYSQISIFHKGTELYNKLSIDLRIEFNIGNFKKQLNCKFVNCEYGNFENKLNSIIIITFKLQSELLNLRQRDANLTYLCHVQIRDVYCSDNDKLLRADNLKLIGIKKFKPIRIDQLFERVPIFFSGLWHRRSQQISCKCCRVYSFTFSHRERKKSLQKSVLLDRKIIVE